MKPTPEKIEEIRKSAPPYQVDDLMKNYIGQKICWDLLYASVTKKNKSSLAVLLFSLDLNVIISCDIDENSFPLIKIMTPKTPIKLVGIIEEINQFGGIHIKDAQLHEINHETNQIYFPQGSREELMSFLEGKILGAKNIKIYDPYPSDDILKLLESASPKAEIKLLGKEIDELFSAKISAFNVYFNKNLFAKKINVSHARFYIIDDEVLQVDSSLRNFGGNKATMIHIINTETAETIKKDFDKWWNTIEA